MPPALASATSAHRAAVESFLAAARAIPANAWERPLADGKWTPAEVAEHVRLTYGVLQNELAGGSGLRIRSPWLVRQVLRLTVLPRILATGTLPRGARASSEIRPRGNILPREQLLEALEVAANVAQKSVARHWDDPRAGLTHHVFGRVDIRRGLRFITVHTRHHARQLEEALGAAALG